MVKVESEDGSYGQALLDLNQDFLNKVLEIGRLKVRLKKAEEAIASLGESNKQLNQIILNSNSKEKNEKSRTGKSRKLESSNSKN